MRLTILKSDVLPTVDTLGRNLFIHIFYTKYTYTCTTTIKVSYACVLVREYCKASNAKSNFNQSITILNDEVNLMFQSILNSIKNVCANEKVFVEKM